MNFKERREQLLLTQEDVAHALNVSIRTVANWDAGSGPSKKAAIEIDRYFEQIQNKRQKPTDINNTNYLVDRGFMIEVLCRNVLWQIAKDRAERAGVPDDWRKYLKAIDEDTPEVMNDLIKKVGIING